MGFDLSVNLHYKLLNQIPERLSEEEFLNCFCIPYPIYPEINMWVLDFIIFTYNNGSAYDVIYGCKQKNNDKKFIQLNFKYKINI